MKQARLGVVGSGVGAAFVAKAMKQLEPQGYAKLVSVSSKRDEHARTFASQFGLESWFTDHVEMFSKAGLDIAVICTPHHLHYPVAVDAIERGLHTLVDKPLAIDLKEADAMIERARAAGVKLGTILEFRFSEPVRALKSTVDTGGLGRLILGEAEVDWYRDQAYYSQSSWRGKASTEGGGALMNQGIHTLDLLLHVLGDVCEAYAKCGTFAHEIEVEDLAAVLMRFRSGAFGTLTASTAAYPGFPTRLEVHGTKGSGTLEGLELRLSTKEGLNVAREERSGLEAWAKPEAVPPTFHASLITDFVRSVIEDRRPIVDGVEGRRSLELVRAIYASARDNRVVTLPFEE